MQLLYFKYGLIFHPTRILIKSIERTLWTFLSIFWYIWYLMDCFKVKNTSGFFFNKPFGKKNPVNTFESPFFIITTKAIIAYKAPKARRVCRCFSKLPKTGQLCGHFNILKLWTLWILQNYTANGDWDKINIKYNVQPNSFLDYYRR